jgi:hypothetical protein
MQANEIQIPYRVPASASPGSAVEYLRSGAQFSIDLAAMTDLLDLDDPVFVINGIDDPIIALPDPQAASGG